LADGGSNRPKYCKVYSCVENVNQDRCSCKNFPRLAHCKCKEGGVKDYSGVCVFPDVPFVQKELFSIGDLKVTPKVIGVTAIVLIVLGILVFAIMSYIAYRKREAIKV